MILPADLLDIAHEALMLVVVLSLPSLGIAFIAALLSAALQSFTRISEPALSYVPRIIAVGATVVIAGPWIADRLSGFAERVWTLIQLVQI